MIANFRQKNKVHQYFSNFSRNLTVELPSEIESKLNQAIEQIKSKDYGLTLPLKNTYRYALVFSKNQRQIVASRQLDKA